MMWLSQVARWTGGKMHGQDLPLQAVVTDTRAMEPGCLFVALQGERFDAHEFLSQAQQGGAVAALVSQPQQTFTEAVQVNDTRQGLGQLAGGFAHTFAASRLAITGNAGKTTVKEMAALLLGDRTLATQGNLNNDIGVPLTLLRLHDQHRYAVVELGANAPGEIAWTSGLVQPEVALITNVTGAHLEGFGSMQGIAEAKAEIFTGCRPGGTAIINNDDGFAAFFADKAQAAGLHCVHIATESEAHWYATNIESDRAGSRFLLQPLGQTVTIPLPGAHQVNNALMAIAAVSALGVEVAPLLDRLATLKPVPGRMQLHSVAAGTLVDDSYNANPGSVRAAIDWLADQPAPRQLVLGALGELGEQGARLLRELGEHARQAGVALVTLPGAEDSALGYGEQARRAETMQQAADWSVPVLEQGGTVLVKGSRSAGTEAVVQQLTPGVSPQPEGAH